MVGFFYRLTAIMTPYGVGLNKTAVEAKLLPICTEVAIIFVFPTLNNESNEGFPLLGYADPR